MFHAVCSAPPFSLPVNFLSAGRPLSETAFSGFPDDLAFYRIRSRYSFDKILLIFSANSTVAVAAEIISETGSA